MNLAECSAAKIGPARCCAVCGTACVSRTNPRWLQALLAGAAAHSLSVKRPDALKCHESCRDALNELIERRRIAARSNNVSSVS